MKPGKLFLGTSGLVLPVPNKLFYPDEFRDKSRLSYYGFLYNTIEINSSFYKVPMARTVSRWADSVPPGFQFTFKLSKAITHNKALAYNPADVTRFMEIIENAGDKKGCLLVQFPAGLTADHTTRLMELFDTIRSLDKYCRWKLSVEFRHQSWYTTAMYEWLHTRDISVVSHDIAPLPPHIDDANGWIYLRFHGPEKGYRGSYDREHLERYAAEIRSFMQQGKAVYAYFNNTLGEPIGNLETLRSLMTTD